MEAMKIIMEIKYKVSVIISTRNRETLLSSCLDSLINQTIVQENSYEIIIVDNGSKDNTKQIASSAKNKFKHIKYIYQGKLGLSKARNTGAFHATGEIICFLDDDTVAVKNYIKEVMKSFSNDNVVCVGGKIVASWPHNTKPNWFNEKFGHVVGQTSFGDKSRFMKKNEFPFGGNIAFRKEVFNKFKGFNESLGRKGNNYITGEEINLCYKLQKKGHEFFYNNEAIMFHIVGKTRATKEFFLTSLFGKGITEGYQKKNNRGILIFFLYLFIKIFLICLSYLKIILLPINEEDKFKPKCRVSYNLGYIYFFLLGQSIEDLQR